MLIKLNYKLLSVLFFGLILLGTFACTKYRDVPGKYDNFTPPADGKIGFGSLRINEFICKGSDPSTITYLGGSNSKWFELYNPTNSDITLSAGKWFITDTLGNKTKFAIPQNTLSVQWKVPAKGYLMVVCVKAGSTTPATGKINTNFSLSSTIGDIGIYYQESATSALVTVDAISYNFGAGALSGVSYGRNPDGQDPATLQLSSVTPEASNK